MLDGRSSFEDEGEGEGEGEVDPEWQRSADEVEDAKKEGVWRGGWMIRGRAGDRAGPGGCAELGGWGADRSTCVFLDQERVKEVVSLWSREIEIRGGAVVDGELAAFVSRCRGITKR